MLTNQDINKLKSIFATKEEFKELKNEFIDIVTNFKDTILTEIIKIREDIAVITGYRELIEDHEAQITKLESKKIIHS